MAENKRISKKLNSYDLSRTWFDWCFENASKISTNHTALYFFAIEQANRMGWAETFGFPTTMAMHAIGIKSYTTYIKTLNDLVEFGFIKMVEKSKNQFSANIIALLNFDKALDKSLDKALATHLVKQVESACESIVSINKQQTIKPINHKPLTNVSESRTEIFSIEFLKENFNSDFNFKICQGQKITPEKNAEMQEVFFAKIDRTEKFYEYKTARDCRSHYDSWLKIELLKEKNNGKFTSKTEDTIDGVNNLIAARRVAFDKAVQGTDND